MRVCEEVSAAFVELACDIDRVESDGEDGAWCGECVEDPTRLRQFMSVRGCQEGHEVTQKIVIQVGESEHSPGIEAQQVDLLLGVIRSESHFMCPQFNL